MTTIDKIIEAAAAARMTPANLIESLSAALADDSKAKQAAEHKAKVLANIQATRTDTVGTGKREYDYLANDLRNHGISESLADLVWKTPQEIDQIFAAAELGPEQRVAAKRFMGRMVMGRV
jgi:hypothetical protein